MDCAKATALLIAVVSLPGVFSIPIEPLSSCGYQSCHQIDSAKINVHLVPHSHDDVGWLKTKDQYYYGSHRDIQNAGVQYTISSTFEALKKNPDRRFIQVETAFFWMWWQDQDETTRNEYISLVKNGQLELINGAWSMNDEAAAHYQSIIENFSWGLRTLNETLGKCGRPRIGWQIDPFGHSREHASISHQLGFDGLIIGRLDYRDKDNRKAKQALDFLWRTSSNLDESEIVTSMFPDFYVSPSGTCWDITCGGDEYINDNEDSPDYNLKQKVDDFSKVMDDYAKFYQTSNILIPMGSDFHYQAAEINFVNIDRLIKGFQDHEKYNVMYSTPSCYIKAVTDEISERSLELPLKTDDFFPYASDQHSFWTGYFTSRPTTKRFERLSHNILQALKQLTTYSKINAKDYDHAIVALHEAVGIMQHHDAITGTEKQAVTFDYVRLLTKAIHEAERPVGVIIGDLLKKDAAEIDLNLSTCLLANVSICDVSKSDRFMVAVYNPSSHAVNHYVRLPVESATYTVTGPDGEEDIDILDGLAAFDYIPNASPSPKELVFTAKNVPALGLKLYYIEKTSSVLMKIPMLDDDLAFGDEVNGFTIDSVTNLLNSVTINGQTLQLTQQFLYYEASSSDNSKPENRSSGAYIFRPKASEAQVLGSPVEIIQQRGKLVDEVKQIFDADEQITQIIRVYKGQNDSYIEFDWLVGNLKVDETNLIGKEIITRFTVKDFTNDGVFYTDSNGREQLRRELNTRSDYEYDPSEEPVSSNYYPITSRIVIKDEEKNLEVAVLNDRAQGGSSLRDGEIELMILRRLLHDDDFGVGEALNETEFDKGLYVRGQHYLTLGPITNDNGVSTSARERILAVEKILTPWTLVADATSDEFNTLEKVEKLLDFKFGGLNVTLPDNIQLLSLEPWSDDSYLLRLEHFLEKNEDDILSQNATVNLMGLFRDFTVTDVRETTLDGNRWLDEQQSEKLTIHSNERIVTEAVDPSNIELSPMQIRTFIVRISAN